MIGCHRLGTSSHVLELIRSRDVVKEPVRPLAREVSGSNNPLSTLGVGFNALVREPSLGGCFVVT